MRGILKANAANSTSLFTKGEILEAKVIRSFGPHGALVRIRGIDMLAATAKSFAAGESILVKIESLEPQLVVSLLLNDTPLQERTAGLLRLYLPSSSGIGSMLGELETLVAGLSKNLLENSGIEKVMAELKNIVMRYTGKSKNILALLGLFHESELMYKDVPTQNLKRSLLILKQTLEKFLMENPARRRALSVVTKALQNIELRQLMNLSDTQEYKSWQLPYWNGQNLSTARLYVKRDGTRGKAGKDWRKEAIRLTLMLEMSRIGPLRAEITSLRERIEGIIYLSTDEAVNKVEKQLPELTASLKALGCSAGFHVHRASIDFLTEEVLGEMKLPVKNLLNVKA